MQLRFLGRTYRAGSSTIETIPAQYEARFLGQTYIPTLPIQKSRSQKSVRKYRGISYEA